jgi:DNA-binding GntR family transcriptional regulator
MAGVFKPGQKMLLRPLASELGISVTPVREALLQLVSEQALLTDSSRSIIVPVLTRERYHEIRDLRVDLEGKAAAAATKHVTREDLRKLAGIHKEMIKARARGDFRESLILNEQFHFCAYSLARMPVLQRIIESLWAQMGPILNRIYGKDVAYQPEHAHVRLIDALERRDANGAKQAVADDILWASPILEAELEPQPTPDEEQ